MPSSLVASEVIGKHERGEAVPSIDAAKEITYALGVSIISPGEGVQIGFD